MLLTTQKCHCPYCGERIEVVIDTSVSEQEMIEDCSVCCRPIYFSIYSDYETGETTLYANTEND